MAILKIARMGHPVLKRRADPVAEPGAPEVRRLIADMIETLRDAGGVGLAAPQVHTPLRIVLLDIPAARDEADEGLPLSVLINPEIETLGEELVEDEEACLSVPGLAGRVTRHAAIRYRALDRAGAPIERDVAGFLARVVQHECDHLDGILYPMRMTDLSSLSFTSELGRAAPEEV